MSKSILSSFSQSFSIFPLHFSRRRGVLGPRTVMMSLVAMSDPGRRSYSRGLTAVREAIDSAGGDLSVLAELEQTSRSAFSQARRKLGWQVCLEGFHHIRQNCDGARSLRCGYVHGRRPVAIDGTRLCLPVSDELGEVFGYHPGAGSQSGVPMAGLVLLWDISANQPIAWHLNDARLNERASSFELIDQLDENDVLIADRGYPSFAFFAALRDRSVDFIIRANTTTVSIAAEIQDFLDSGADEAVVECPPVRNQHRRFEGDAPMVLRLIRDREHGDRVLVTSLLDAAVTRREILDAYRRRWKIETAIREGKEWRGLEDFRALYADGIRQEIVAIMTFLYLVGEMEAELRSRVQQRVQQGEEPAEAMDEIPYTFNRVLMASMAVTMLIKASAGIDISQKWRSNANTLWRERNRKRPGRSYPRVCKKPHGKTRRTGPYKTRK